MDRTEQQRVASSPAASARGVHRLIGPAIVAAIALYFYVLCEPIVETRFFFFSIHELSLVSIASDLYHRDLFLFLVVFVFGILAPGLKLFGFASAWYFLDVLQVIRLNGPLVVLGKLSMLDIMLLAILVVATKGVGSGSIEIRFGLYFYIVLVLGSFLLSVWTQHHLAVLQNEPRR
jgi:hypothetical protein